jgi:GntR family transcriptional regulator / MocR family aminotransferase
MAVQLADELRAAAGCGALRVGDRLPSTRALAITLGVSRTVTAAAYDVLAAEGGSVGDGARVPTSSWRLACGPGRTPRPIRGQEPKPERGIDLRPGTPWAAACARRPGGELGGLRLTQRYSPARWTPACRNSGPWSSSTCCATVD